MNSLSSSDILWIPVCILYPTITFVRKQETPPYSPVISPDVKYTPQKILDSRPSSVLYKGDTYFGGLHVQPGRTSRLLLPLFVYEKCCLNAMHY